MNINNCLNRWLGSSILVLGMVVAITACGQQSSQYVDGTQQAHALLEKKRSQLISELAREVTTDQLNQLIDLGAWSQAEDYLDSASSHNAELKIVEARLLMKKHRYQKAEHNICDVLSIAPNHRQAKLLIARLHIQAWQLEEAKHTARELLDTNQQDAGAAVIMGQVALLNRQYDTALSWAEKAQQWDPELTESYVLQADTYFWQQQPKAAEKALRRALELNPFNADARFSYGYAIWRRVDATQLDAMAEQWNLALEVNPLHYLTHWHFGNGHTNLTYADYIHPTDTLVEARLDQADSLIAQGKVDEAIAGTHEVEADYPESVLPAMMRGSAFYMHYQMDRPARLDSAQAMFQFILEQKQNYGPAHNGLAAVIKQRQFTFLDDYKELEQTIEETEVPEKGAIFYDVFKDASYYPGNRVTKMIAQQIGPSKAYLPMINKFDSDFAIPPLHVDLAEAMGNSYFRHGTTFDNRQWMDIRGVGSGATGIEYLERGAHQERNVLAHEYAHLYHGRILTDHESRRIRALYYAAMKGNYPLDYYASNNESEYFAQGYAGFLSEQKVHPLNHKSMNTRTYIQQKDPALYAFLDSLIQKQQAYVAGQKSALDDNWAQTHLSLSQNSHRRGELDKAAAHLDTALTYSEDYQPALLAYAKLEAEQANFDAADQMVAKAMQLDSTYAPIYLTQANITHQKALERIVPFDEAIASQVSLFDKSYQMESDLDQRANINRIYRQRLEDYSQIAEAIEVADNYVQEAPTVSTYLRDEREAAKAYADFLRSSLGYSKEVLDDFKTLVEQNPQHFGYRRMYAEVLHQAGQQEEALERLEEGQRILESADEERPGYTLRMTQLHIEEGDIQQAKEMLESLDAEEVSGTNKLLLVRLYGLLGNPEKGKLVLEELEQPRLPYKRAAVAFAQAELTVAAGDIEQAMEYYQSVLADNPYHLKARLALVEQQENHGNEQAAQALIQEGKELGLNIGTDN